VRDSDGKERGMSKVAGFQGVAQTAVSRCLMVPAACMLLPPVVMIGLRGSALCAPLFATRAGSVLTELSVIYASLVAALPAALAVYPQIMTFDSKELEPQFQGLRDSKGEIVNKFFANKGL
jgi:hypothetical protein